MQMVERAYILSVDSVYVSNYDAKFLKYKQYIDIMYPHMVVLKKKSTDCAFRIKGNF